MPKSPGHIVPNKGSTYFEGSDKNTTKKGLISIEKAVS